jgi:hypothetical protein
MNYAYPNYQVDRLSFTAFICSVHAEEIITVDI